MDAYSSSSKYDARTQSCGHALIVFATYFCLFVFFRLLFSPFPWFSSTNSEEAKSTTWLHPVTGEAVVTGHRKTPGKHPSHAHTQRMRGVIGASRWKGKKKKRGRQLGGGKRAFLQNPCSSATASSAPLPRLPPARGLSRTASTLLPLGGSPPGHFATHFLKVLSRRREPISKAITRSPI